MLLGAHESVAGGPATAIAHGREDGCETVQVFTRQPQQWRTHPLKPEAASLFRSELADVGWPVLAHASYLINLCAADPDVLRRSRQALVEELARAEELGIDYVVLHPGAHLGGGEANGIDAAIDSLGDVFGQTRGFRVRLLLELTAGQGSSLGHTFEQLAAILDGRHGRDDLGICLDTCHAHAAGFDLIGADGYQRTVAELDRIVGVERLLAFHLNDSKTPRGSRVDRHAEIGAGTMGLLPFWRLVNDPRFARVPGVLEVDPGPRENRVFQRNLAVLRNLIGAPEPPGPPPPAGQRQVQLPI